MDYLFALASQMLIPLLLLGLIIFLAFKVIKYFQDLRSKVEAIQNDLILLKANQDTAAISSEPKEESYKV